MWKRLEHSQNFVIVLQDKSFLLVFTVRRNFCSTKTKSEKEDIAQGKRRHTDRSFLSSCLLFPFTNFPFSELLRNKTHDLVIGLNTQTMAEDSATANSVVIGNITLKSTDRKTHTSKNKTFEVIILKMLIKKKKERERECGASACGCSNGFSQHGNYG